MSRIQKTARILFTCLLTAMLVSACDPGHELVGTENTSETFTPSGQDFAKGALPMPWNQFGRTMENSHRTFEVGPIYGVGSVVPLVPATGSIGPYAGVIQNQDDDYIVTSRDPFLHVFDNAGNHRAFYNFGTFFGTRAVPFYDISRNLIYSGTRSGGFFELALTKSGTTYTLMLNSSLAAIRPIDSAPAMALDQTVYAVTARGTLYRFGTSPLAVLNSINLNTYEPRPIVKGALALADVDPGSPAEEVIVATEAGNLYVFSHDLLTLLGSNNYGSTMGDQYRGGVTVAFRTLTGEDPIALLGVAGGGTSTYSGMVRAINLRTFALEWDYQPSGTTLTADAILGSISVMHPMKGYHFGAAASTDGFVYGFHLTTTPPASGREIWNFAIGAGCIPQDAPSVGDRNRIYTTDGCGNLHGIDGGSGAGLYSDGSMNPGTLPTLPGNVAITFGGKLGVTVDNTAYIVRP